VQPVIAAGHSAGAAILIRMALERYIRPRLLISINGALLPQANIPGWLYTPLAKALARRGWVSRFLARTANTRSIERLVADTGSRLDEKGIALYRQLAQRPTHVAAALSMMANWDLVAFAAELPSLEVPLVLLTASGDRTVLPKQATRAQALLPQARLISFGELGHLGHEEQPAEVAQLMLRLAAEAGVLPFRS
jgi:magnesium chelatase accessory protein